MNSSKGLLVAACLMFSPLGMADSHRDAAHQLLDAMNINQLMEQTIDSHLALGLKQNPSLRPYKETMRKFFNVYLSGESLREDLVDMYEEAFTEQELLKLTEFYQTELGKKVISVEPIISAQATALGEYRLQEKIHVLERMLEEEARRLESLQTQNRDK